MKIEYGVCFSHRFSHQIFPYKYWIFIEKKYVFEIPYQTFTCSKKTTMEAHVWHIFKMSYKVTGTTSIRHSGVFNTDVKQMQYVLNSSKTTTSLRLKRFAQMSYGIKYLKTNSIMIFLIQPSGWKDLLLKHGCFRRLFLLRYTYLYLFNAISDDQWKLD